MKQHKEILIKNSIEKAEQALKDTKSNLDADSLLNAQNRAYYAVFYIVLALAYMNEFTTGKHYQLMGWFNKKYIHENKTFDKGLNRIYQRLLLNRQVFDYDVSKFPVKEHTTQDFEDAKIFVNEVKKFILNNIENLSDD